MVHLRDVSASGFMRGADFAVAARPGRARGESTRPPCVSARGPGSYGSASWPGLTVDVHRDAWFAATPEASECRL